MPKIVDHAAERELLLDASFRLFAEEGYAQATMRRIARAAGVSTGKLYHYFPDKPSILDHLFVLLLQRDTARVRSALPADAPVPDRVRALFRFYGEHADYLRHLLRLALEVHRHEPSASSREQVREGLRQYRAALAEVLGVEGVLVQALFSLIVGSLAEGLLDPDAVDLAEVERFVLEVWGRLGP